MGRLLGDVDELTICLGEREVVFTVGDVQIVTRLIEGEYPNYRGLIPDDHPNSLVVERDDMLDALRRVRLLATDNTPVRLVMSSDGLELIAITQDIGQAQDCRKRIVASIRAAYRESSRSQSGLERFEDSLGNAVSSHRQDRKPSRLR